MKIDQRDHSKPFVVVAALIERDGKFLLVQENWGHVKGLWNLPAGWLDLGENPLDGAIREVKEETGYDFKPTSLLGIYASFKAEGEVKKHPVRLVFRGEISGTPSKVDETEISARKWFSPEEIYQMDKPSLRDIDIKLMVQDYLSGKEFPLNIIHHKVHR